MSDCLGNAFANEDLFLAFCSGRATLNGHLATPDQWAFTLHGTVWVDQSWLSHFLYYLSFHYLEYLGPVLIKGFLLLACVVLLYIRCRSFDITPEISLLAVTLGVLSCAPFLKIRGENFGMFLFVVMVMLLTSRASPVRWRQLGALVVLAVWSNSHGSFMLGFFLIAFRFMVDAFFTVWKPKRQPSPQLEDTPDTGKESTHHSDTPQRPPVAQSVDDVWGWLATTVLAVGVMAFLNPYGHENLVIPFRQLFTPTVTTEWVDWRPLFHWHTFFTRGFFRPVSVLPFILLSALTVLLLVLPAVSAGIRQGISLLFSKSAGADKVMALLIPLLLAPLVLKYQRMILFAATAMVPPVAILIQGAMVSFGKRVSQMRESGESGYRAPVTLALSVLLLATVSLVFYKSVFIRHLSGNPLTFLSRDQPLISRLMSRNFMRTDVVRFLNSNHIKGRVFTNVHLSGYLLFHVPDIRVYFDLRAQSVFPDEIVRGYLSVVARRTPIESILQFLDRSGIDLVVLDTSKSSNAWVADRLMQTMKWGCIYADEWVIVLAGRDSPRLGSMVKSANLDRLHYERPKPRPLVRHCSPCS